MKNSSSDETKHEPQCNLCWNDNEDSILYWDDELDYKSMENYTCLCSICYGKLSNKWTITAPSDSYSSEETFDDYEDAYQYCIETEIIYYNKAMEYLSEHDWSLTESAEIASDLGFELKNINSEMLATLHLQNELINSIKEIEVENQI